MKKVLFFAAAATMLAACSNTDELASLQTVQNDQESSINFEVYTSRATTRAGLPGGYDAANSYGVTTYTLQSGRHASAGFGVFGYYTSNSVYDTNSSIPNFMYNQKVTFAGTAGTAPDGTAIGDDNSKWTYEPVKYWPNEFGDAALSDDVDRISFFAYAPWQQVTVNTGVPVTTVDAAYVADHMTQLASNDDVAKKLLGATDWATFEADAKATATALYNAANATTFATFADWKADGTHGAAATAMETAINDIPTQAKADYQAGIESRMADQKLNITQMTKNSASGDPVIKYVVDMHPNTSVDLLWGVAAPVGTDPTADYTYNGIKNKLGNPTSTIQAGNTFVDLTKQGDVSGKVKWYFKHALARLNVQICTTVDKATPGEGTDEIGQEANGDNPKASHVWLRSIKFTNGFAQKGALNLNSEPVTTGATNADRVKNAKPKWLDYDGSTELTFEDVILFDGLKDGKEGIANNIQKNETPTGINPILTQANPLYTGVPIKLTNLFEGSLTPDDPIYVIPDPNQTEEMYITVQYDVETADKRLAGTLADGVTKGSSIENIITKSTGKVIEPGKAYVIKIYLGLESVKYDVEVVDWLPGTTGTEVELPKNE